MNVIVKPVGRWLKDSNDVVNGYELRLLEMGQTLKKLLNALDIAAHFDKQISWSKYQLLIGLVAEHQRSVDFVRDALIYGLHLQPVYDVPITSDRRLQRIYAKIFGPTERRQYFLMTNKHAVHVMIPDEWNCWLNRYKGGDEIIYKEHGHGLEGQD